MSTNSSSEHSVQFGWSEDVDWEKEFQRYNVFYVCSFCDERYHSKNKMICHFSSHARVDTNSRILNWLSSLSYSQHEREDSIDRYPEPSQTFSTYEIKHSRKRKVCGSDHKESVYHHSPAIKRQRLHRCLKPYSRHEITDRQREECYQLQTTRQYRSAYSPTDKI